MLGLKRGLNLARVEHVMSSCGHDMLWRLLPLHLHNEHPSLPSEKEENTALMARRSRKDGMRESQSWRQDKQS